MMENSTGYFKRMFDAIKSILAGMGVTIRYGVNAGKEVTQQYPEVKREPYDRFRGKLFVEIGICTGCTACARICPVDAILLKTVRDENKKLRPVVFDIDNARCIYCGLCVEACPVKDCLYFRKEYEFSSYSKEALISHFGLGELPVSDKPAAAAAPAGQPVPVKDQAPAGTQQTDIAAPGTPAQPAGKAPDEAKKEEVK